MTVAYIQELIDINNIIKFYKSKEWQALRKKKLAVVHECEMCKKRGKYSSVDIVHHIVEVRKAPNLALDYNNLMCVCFKCHEQIHDKFKKYNENKDKFSNVERW